MSYTDDNTAAVTLSAAARRALGDAPEGMRARLRKMIERTDPYFILTGSDPREKGGCCPSDDVGAANVLSETGVLQAMRQPAPSNACPVTLYAFAGEIRGAQYPPSFELNPALRAAVLKELASPTVSTRRRLLFWARIALLAFVALSVASVFIKGRPRSDAKRSVAAAANLGNVDCTLVVLFRGNERCTFCNNMEAYTRLALETDFSAELALRRVVYREINIDDPANASFIERFGLLSSSVALFEIRSGRETRWTVLIEAWRLFDDKQAFLAMFGAEARKFRAAGGQ